MARVHVCLAGCDETDFQRAPHRLHLMWPDLFEVSRERRTRVTATANDAQRILRWHGYLD